MNKNPTALPVPAVRVTIEDLIDACQWQGRERQTILKRVAAAIRSGQHFITYSGHFYDPVVNKKVSGMLGKVIDEVTPQLQPPALLDHDFPVLDGGVKDQMLDKALDLMREAIAQRKPKQFRALANAVYRLIQEPEGLRLETDVIDLLFQAQLGRVNIRRQAWKLVLGHDKHPGAIEPKELVSPSFQRKLKQIESKERKLRRYCDRLGVRAAATGRPEADK